MRTQALEQNRVDPVYETPAPMPTSRLNFIPTKVGKESTLNINLTNQYDYPITLNIECNSDQFKTSTSRVVLKAKEKVKIGVTFAPKKVGTWFGMVVFTQSPGSEKRFFTVLGKALPKS